MKVNEPQHIETLRFMHPEPYADMYECQVARRTAVEHGDNSNALMLLEHAPTFTLGRNSDEKNLLQSREALQNMGIDVLEVDRGGDVTYHGPGQLVAYPILDLQHWEQSVSWYLRTLEEVIIRFLDSFGLKGERMENFTGVWVEGAKIAAIGIGVHQWVTYHGVAINLDPNMEHWNLIVPCGIPDKPVTSLKALLGESPSLSEAMKCFDKCFRDVFQSNRES